MHVYLSDRLFVALAKRLGVPRRRLATLRTRQQRQVRSGVAVTLFTLARLEEWIDERSADRLLSYARRVIKKHPKYRRDLIEVRQPSRRRRGGSSDALPALDAHADAAALSIESLFGAPVQVTPVHVTPVQVTPVQVTPLFVATAPPEPIGYQAEPLFATPIGGAPALDIGDLLRCNPSDFTPADEPAHASAGDATPMGQDLGADSSLFAVTDWSASDDFADPFAASQPFDSSEDPFAAAACGSLDTIGDPFAAAAAARQNDAFGPLDDPFASVGAAEDPFTSTEDPFANSSLDPYASVGGDPFAASGSPNDWRGRDSQEFDPFGPAVGRASA